MSDEKKGQDEMSASERENLGKVLNDLSSDLQVIVNLFEVLTRSPDVVTTELLDKAKTKVKGILTRVKEAETKIHEPVAQPALAMKGEAGSQNPIIILDDVMAMFDDQLNTSMALSPDQIHTLNMPDQQFEAVLKTLFDSAVNTQTGVNQKTCEVSMGVSGGNLILKFKDFGRSIPEEEVDRMFDGDNSVGGYPFYRLKKIVQASGGDVEVDSGRTKFTTFTLKIPFNE